MHNSSLVRLSQRVCRVRLKPLAAAVMALVAGGGMLHIVDPARAWYMPKCLFYQLTGLYCPGCGSGRALHQLAHGNLAAAWRLNPLMVLAIPLLIYLVAKSSVPARPGASYSVLPRWLPWVIVGAIFVFWVARNIPLYPFTLLAPH